MCSQGDRDAVLVTGACGHIGQTVCHLLRASGIKVLPVDLGGNVPLEAVACDLTQKDQVARLFQSHPIRTVIHLAAVLPSAFRLDPLGGAEVNLSGSFHLMRQAVDLRVNRFIFASSMSVYGSSNTSNPINEDHAATPDDPYGASKRAVELVGETLASKRDIQFISLRIARVVGPGIKRTSSPWRSQMFELSSGQKSICIPFAPDARLSLVHVEDAARMFVTLVHAAEVNRCIYNTPAEIWKARQLKEIVETTRGIRVELVQNAAGGGPICDGSRFAREFGFQSRGLTSRLLGAI